MSLATCLPGLEADGKITADQAADARRLYEELLEEHLRQGSRESAEALASSEVLAALERQVTRKAFLAGRTIKTRQRIARELGGYVGDTGDGRFKNGGGAGGPIDPKSGPALIDHDPRAAYSNVEGRRKAILGDAHRAMDSVLSRFSADLLGRVRDKTTLREMVRELFGEDTGNHAARELATAWRKSSEMLRQRFNRAGGAIGFRADWGLPQSHDWRAVRKAGFEAWRAEILPRLDLSRMIDDATGRPFTREKLEAILPEIFDNIRSDGALRATPGAPGGKALANRRADPRFFVFKSADDWLAYAEGFGSGSAYDAMVGHMEMMARDIAAMEILGPNPEATLRWVKDTIEQSAKLDRDPGTKAVKKASSAAKSIDALWDEYRGANLEPRNETLALTFSSLRAIQVATKLGSATLSAVSDVGFQMSRRAFNGLGKGSLLPDYVKLMRPGSLEDQKLAVRRGLIAEEWSNRTAAQNRYLMEELTGEIPRRLASGILRLSLLSRHTQNMRWVYGMETLSTYTEMAGRSYDGLDPKLRGALARYGISAGDWDRLRTAKMDVDRGVEWISPHNVGDDDLASRFMEMVLEETDLAVPVPDLATRRAVHFGTERGTWGGELVRSLMLFKSFGVSVILRQSAEILAMQPATAARYAGGLIIGTTLLGGLALQLKAVAQGKDPRPMLDPEFWIAAMLQGGGFGIFGDFLHSAQNRAGGGFAQTLAGPLVDDAQGIVNVAKAKDPRKSIVREAKGFIPGNNLWYTRLAFDRMLADQIEQAVNPDYANSRKRIERYAAEQGTRFWWRPGAGAPVRAPDFANAFAEGVEE